MDIVEELIYKLEDNSYNLTEEDIKYLNLSLFVLLKEKIITKDINNKTIYFDCQNTEYINQILDIGNTIKEQIINDGKPTTQTVNVQLINKYIYKGDLEELKQALYYVHRLRDWLVHKDYYVKDNMLFIKPFNTENTPINYYEPNYEVKLDISKIESLSEKRQLDYALELLYKNFNYRIKRLRGIEIDPIIIMFRKKNNRMFLDLKTGYASIISRNEYNYRKIPKSIKLLYKKRDELLSDEEPSNKYLIELSSDELNQQTFNEAINFYEGERLKGNKKPILVRFNKVFSKDDFVLKNILDELGIEKEELVRKNYYLAAIYNYAVNVYATHDKDIPNPKYFNLRNFKYAKVDKNKFIDKDNSFNKDLDEFKDILQKQLTNINKTSNFNRRKIIGELFQYLVNFYNDKIDNYLTTQKGLIVKNIRNSIDHGNISIDVKTGDVELYDMDDNTLAVNDNNCKAKIKTSIDSLHSHIDEYNSDKDKRYTLKDVIKDIEYISGNTTMAHKLEFLFDSILSLALRREVNLDNLSMEDAFIEYDEILKKDAIIVINEIKKQR